MEDACICVIAREIRWGENEFLYHLVADRTLLDGRPGAFWRVAWAFSGCTILDVAAAWPFLESARKNEATLKDAPD